MPQTHSGFPTQIIIEVLESRELLDPFGITVLNGEVHIPQNVDLTKVRDVLPPGSKFRQWIKELTFMSASGRPMKEFKPIDGSPKELQEIQTQIKEAGSLSEDQRQQLLADYMVSHPALKHYLNFSEAVSLLEEFLSDINAVGGIVLNAGEDGAPGLDIDPDWADLARTTLKIQDFLTKVGCTNELKIVEE